MLQERFPATTLKDDHAAINRRSTNCTDTGSLTWASALASTFTGPALLILEMQL